jgi:transposase
LKEKFLNIFSKETTKQQARIKIINWVNAVLKTRFKVLAGLAKSILNRLEKLLNWFDDKISNGKAEGINNVIKTLFKRAYGYKDMDYLKMIILQKCGYLMKCVTHTF